jgi:ribonuclease HI
VPEDSLFEIMVDGSGDGHSIALFPGEEIFLSYERGASNNDAEFNAVILALENLPEHSRARIQTDSQVVVWHLAPAGTRRRGMYSRKKAQVQALIAEKDLDVEFRWVPRKENRADRLLKNYIASLCGAGGTEPLHRRVRRLEVDNTNLRARRAKAMKMRERRPAATGDAGAARTFQDEWLG